jgi:hypothetical protein
MQHLEESTTLLLIGRAQKEEGSSRLVFLLLSCLLQFLTSHPIRRDIFTIVPVYYCHGYQNPVCRSLDFTT